MNSSDIQFLSVQPDKVENVLSDDLLKELGDIPQTFIKKRTDNAPYKPQNINGYHKGDYTVDVNAFQ